MVIKKNNVNLQDAPSEKSGLMSKLSKAKKKLEALQEKLVNSFKKLSEKSYEVLESLRYQTERLLGHYYRIKSKIEELKDKYLILRVIIAILEIFKMLSLLNAGRIALRQIGNITLRVLLKVGIN